MNYALYQSQKPVCTLILFKLKTKYKDYSICWKYLPTPSIFNLAYI